MPERQDGVSASDIVAKVGDIVIFTCTGKDSIDSWGHSPWRLGRIAEIAEKEHIHTAVVEYTTGTKKKLKGTLWSLRSLVILNTEEKMDEMHAVA